MAAMCLAYLQVRELSAGKYHCTPPGEEVWVFFWLTSPHLCSLSKVVRGILKAAFQLWEKCSHLCLMQCMGKIPSSCTSRMMRRWACHLQITDRHLKASQNCSNNCSRCLQRQLASPPSELLSCSTSSSFLNLGFPTAKPFSSCLAFFPSTPT